MIHERSTDPRAISAFVDRATDLLHSATTVPELQKLLEELKEPPDHTVFGLENKNRLTEIKLRAQRKAGKLLGEAKLHGGDRRSKSHRSNRVTLKLKDLKIEKISSSRWQRLAAIPTRIFESYLSRCRREPTKITTAGLLRFAEEQNHVASSCPIQRSLKRFVATSRKFGCIYVKPRWSRDKVADACRNLRKLPLQQIAARRSHLHLQVPAPDMAAGLNLLSGWRFTYATASVLSCPSEAIRSDIVPISQFVLLGVRGDLPLRNHALSDHSSARDAERVLDTLARISPGPYLSLFAEAPDSHWTSVCEDPDRPFF